MLVYSVGNCSALPPDAQKFVLQSFILSHCCRWLWFIFGIICLFPFRVQTPISSTSPRTPCPVGSTSLWPPMTPFPCPQRLTLLTHPQWASNLLSCCAQRPKALLDCCVAASASPPSLSTWRPPQRCRRSRGTCPTPSYQAARTTITSTILLHLKAWSSTTTAPPHSEGGGAAICTVSHMFPTYLTSLPPPKPPLSF